MSEIGKAVLSISMVIIMMALFFIPIIYDIKDTMPKKYDKIHDKEKVMNKRERIEDLQEQIDILRTQLRKAELENNKYARALVFLSKFKFEYIKNKVLREETKQHSLTYGYYAISKTESVVNDLDNYHADAVVQTYDYIKQQLKKDNELAIYNSKVKTKVVNGWSAGPVCSAITSADYMTPYAVITKSKKKKKAPKKK